MGSYSLTLVTNRLKLLDTRGRLSASFLVLNSRATPCPPALPPGNLGKFGGNNELKSISETLVVMLDVDGTPNFLAGGGGGTEGGNEGARRILLGPGTFCTTAPINGPLPIGEDIGAAEEGTETYSGRLIVARLGGTVQDLGCASLQTQWRQRGGARRSQSSCRWRNGRIVAEPSSRVSVTFSQAVQVEPDNSLTAVRQLSM